MDLPIEKDPRRGFTEKQKAEIFLRDKGRCAICKRKVMAGEPWVGGHKKEHGSGGRTTVDNGQIECMECAPESARQSTKRMAKADRQGGRTGQQARRKTRKHNPWQTDKFKKKLNGRTEKRDDCE